MHFYQCPVKGCFYKSNVRATLGAHIRQEHPERKYQLRSSTATDISPKFECDFCGCPFMKRRALTIHLGKFHPSKKETQEMTNCKIVCEKCPLRFSFLEQYAEHYFKEHGDGTISGETLTKTFALWSEFEKWLRELQVGTYSAFSIETSIHRQFTYYRCRQAAPRRGNRTSSIKAVTHCTAFVKVKAVGDDSYEVKYFPFHNHETNIKDARLKKLTIDNSEKPESFDCPVDGCGFSITLPFLLKEHLETNHPGIDFPSDLFPNPSNSLAFECGFCRQYFTTELGLKKHSTKFHQGKESDTLGEPTPTTSKGHFGNETKDDQADELRNTTGDEESPSTSGSQSYSQQFSCDLCFSLFLSEANLKIHQRKIHPKAYPEMNTRTVYQCPECPFKNARQTKYKEHLAMHVKMKKEAEEMKKEKIEEPTCHQLVEEILDRAELLALPELKWETLKGMIFLKYGDDPYGNVRKCLEWMARYSLISNRQLCRLCGKHMRSIKCPGNTMFSWICFNCSSMNRVPSQTGSFFPEMKPKYSYQQTLQIFAKWCENPAIPLSELFAETDFTDNAIILLQKKLVNFAKTWYERKRKMGERIEGLAALEPQVELNDRINDRMNEVPIKKEPVELDESHVNMSSLNVMNLVKTQEPVKVEIQVDRNDLVQVKSEPLDLEEELTALNILDFINQQAEMKKETEPFLPEQGPENDRLLNTVIRKIFNGKQGSQPIPEIIQVIRANFKEMVDLYGGHQNLELYVFDFIFRKHYGEEKLLNRYLFEISQIYDVDRFNKTLKPLNLVSKRKIPLLVDDPSMAKIPKREEPTDLEEAEKTDRAKRKAYSAAYKLEAVNFAKWHSNEETARRFRVAPKMIRDWIAQERELLASDKNSKKLKGGGRKSQKPPQLVAMDFEDFEI